MASGIAAKNRMAWQNDNGDTQTSLIIMAGQQHSAYQNMTRSGSNGMKTQGAKIKRVCRIASHGVRQRNKAAAAGLVA